MEQIEFIEQQAIEAAVRAEWTLAIKLNREILELEEANLAAHMRLGFSYMQVKQYPKAKTHYSKALGIQPSNLIAQENLEKIKLLKTKETVHLNTAHLNPRLFLEVPGKTKSIILVNLGQRDVLASLTIGQEVKIIAKKRKIEIRNNNDEYIGTLPDDIARRLLVFIEADSEYDAFIKEATLNRVIIFMREKKKGSKVAMHISFTQSQQPEIIPTASSDTDDGDNHDEEEEKDHIDAMVEALDRDPEEQINIQNQEEEEESEE